MHNDSFFCCVEVHDEIQNLFRGQLYKFDADWMKSMVA